MGTGLKAAQRQHRSSLKIAKTRSRTDLTILMFPFVPSCLRERTGSVFQILCAFAALRETPLQ
jgi:hypothetical protein